ncbi:hypothetical protein, partial [Pseudomonas aeruginosa]|uniref:hypothetical protein n=1 Tax=Pseudomonas aeruginosa TaxID=287 RepID=UPI001F1CC7C5
LLALTGVLGIGEGHLFHHRKARRLVSGDFAKSGSLFQDFPYSFYWVARAASLDRVRLPLLWKKRRGLDR